MSFVEGFYSFNLEINNTASGVYTKTRIKTARHPDEDIEYLCARVLAFCHCYQPEQSFTQGLFEPREPAIWRKDILGELKLWVDVGCPSFKKLKRALREDSQTDYRVYFLTEEELENFCGYLRGSKSNWIASVRFFLLDYDFLVKAGEDYRSSSNWSLTILEDTIYIEINRRELETKVIELDMWSHFQNFLISSTI